jgi:hypothetical protein
MDGLVRIRCEPKHEDWATTFFEVVLNNDRIVPGNYNGLAEGETCTLLKDGRVDHGVLEADDERYVQTNLLEKSITKDQYFTVECENGVSVTYKIAEITPLAKRTF